MLNRLVEDERVTSVERGQLWTTTAAMLENLVRATRRREDLTAAIACARKAVEATADTWAAPQALSHLATSLGLEYELFGERLHLEEAATAATQAAEVSEASDPGRTLRMLNAASSWFLLGERERDAGHIDKALELLAEPARTPGEHQAMALLRTQMCRRTRYDITEEHGRSGRRSGGRPRLVELTTAVQPERRTVGCPFERCADHASAAGELDKRHRPGAADRRGGRRSLAADHPRVPACCTACARAGPAPVHAQRRARRPRYSDGSRPSGPAGRRGRRRSRADQPRLGRHAPDPIQSDPGTRRTCAPRPVATARWPSGCLCRIPPDGWHCSNSPQPCGRHSPPTARLSTPRRPSPWLARSRPGPTPIQRSQSARG